MRLIGFLSLSAAVMILLMMMMSSGNCSASHTTRSSVKPNAHHTETAKSPTEGNGSGNGNGGLHLLTQYFNAAQADRASEIRTALALNLNNAQLDYIHILLESAKDFPADLISTKRVSKLPVDVKAKAKGELPKVVISVIGKRLTFAEATKYAQEHLKGQTVLLANADIYFDDTLEALRRIEDLGKSKQVFCLSRYEQRFDGTMQTRLCSDWFRNWIKGIEARHYTGPYGISGDTFIWKSPLQCKDWDDLLKQLDFKLGSWGGEERWMFELKSNCGAVPKDPCYDIISHHLHRKRKGDMQQKPDNEPFMNLNGRSFSPLPGDPLTFKEGQTLKPVSYVDQLHKKHAVVTASPPLEQLVKKYTDVASKEGFLKEMPSESSTK